MKTRVMSFAAALEFKPEHPDRTAKRSVGKSGDMLFDVMFKTWPHRKAMAKTIRMQQSRESRQDDWRPCVPLSDGEGY